MPGELAVANANIHKKQGKHRYALARPIGFWHSLLSFE
jgi:hypothetical protein